MNQSRAAYGFSGMHDYFLDNTIKFTKNLDLILKPLDFSVGTTPHEIAYSEDKMRLLHYEPTTGKKYQVPVLIVYALVNRFYILDLQPDKSIIRYLLDQGFDVYAIDWGYPSGLDRYLTLDDYVNGYLNNAVEHVRKTSGVDKITLMGVCEGGTFSLMYSSLHPEKVKNLITFVAPLDFDTDKALLHIWARKIDVDKVVNTYGIVPGDFLNFGFLLLDPFRLMIDKYVGLFDRMQCEPDDEECQLRNEETLKNFMRMEKWIFDSPGQAGEAFRQFIRDCYQKNLLIKNMMEIGGKRIDLNNVTMPLLNVMAQFDHLVPNDASRPISDAVASTEKETMVFPTGHIGMFVGSRSQGEVCPKIAAWLKTRSLLTDAGRRGRTVGVSRTALMAKPKEAEKKEETKGAGK